MVAPPVELRDGRSTPWTLTFIESAPSAAYFTFVALPSSSLVQGPPSLDISSLKLYEVGESSVRLNRPLNDFPCSSPLNVHTQAFPETVPVALLRSPDVVKPSYVLDLLLGIVAHDGDGLLLSHRTGAIGVEHDKEIPKHHVMVFCGNLAAWTERAWFCFSYGFPVADKVVESLMLGTGLGHLRWGLWPA